MFWQLYYIARVRFNSNLRASARCKAFSCSLAALLSVCLCVLGIKRKRRLRQQAKVWRESNWEKMAAYWMFALNIFSQKWSPARKISDWPGSITRKNWPSLSTSFWPVRYYVTWPYGSTRMVEVVPSRLTKPFSVLVPHGSKRFSAKMHTHILSSSSKMSDIMISRTSLGKLHSLGY